MTYMQMDCDTQLKKKKNHNKLEIYEGKQRRVCINDGWK